jgi:hypothetical protein
VVPPLSNPAISMAKIRLFSSLTKWRAKCCHAAATCLIRPREELLPNKLVALLSEETLQGAISSSLWPRNLAKWLHDEYDN